LVSSWRKGAERLCRLSAGRLCRHSFLVSPLLLTIGDKMMKRCACCLTVWFLFMATAFGHSSAASTRQVRAATFSAKAGFYIQLWRCHACAYIGWQKNVVSTFGRSGIKAFVSDDVMSHYTKQQYWTLKALRLRRLQEAENEGWQLPVFAGPFNSKRAADLVSSQIPSTFTQVFDEIDKKEAETGNSPHWSRQLENCTGNECDIYGFFIQLVRVL